MDPATRKALAAFAGITVSFAPAAHALEPGAGAHAEHQQLWTFHHEGVLGTSLQITVRAADRATASRGEAAALAIFDRDEHILSAWRTDSEFSRWERTRMQPVAVSPELFAVLAAFDRWRERTGGALDPSVEAATRLWKRASEEGRSPTEREIAETAEAIAQPHWMLDPAHRTAMRLSDTPLALASFAKSWISQRAADAALRAGASGITLNVGGDVVVRGAMTQAVAIANPRAAADNADPLEHVLVRDRAVATSGGYMRGFRLHSAQQANSAPQLSHLIDPRTATPVAHVLSSSVIARDAETAGALATAFSVLPVSATERLRAEHGDIEYLLVLADGRRVASPGWERYRLPFLSNAKVQPVSLASVALAPVSGQWDPRFELDIALTLPRVEEFRYRRPYVAVWIEDAAHNPVRTLALWVERPRWLPELRQWYREDRMRANGDSGEFWRTVSSATRPPGKYSLKWDGKDNEGKLVKAGTYTVVFESAREHGGYQIERHEMDFSGKPQQASIASGQELGEISLDYHKQ